MLGECLCFLLPVYGLLVQPRCLMHDLCAPPEGGECDLCVRFSSQAPSPLKRLLQCLYEFFSLFFSLFWSLGIPKSDALQDFY